MREDALGKILRKYWHPVMLSHELGERPVSVRLLDERLAVFRVGGRVRAFSDLCIHRGTPISLGWVEGETIVCAYHGWAYNAEGKCVRIPSVPAEHPIPKKACLTTFPAQERYGLVWVCLSEEPIAPIAEFSESEDPAYRIFYLQRKHWNAGAPRVMENFVDLGHFAWIHDGIFGDRSNPLTPEVQIDREGDELRFWWENTPDKLHVKGPDTVAIEPAFPIWIISFVECRFLV